MSKPIEINYKELLAKYMRHVSDCEGVDFVSEVNSYRSDVKFTDEEVKALREIKWETR